MAGESCPSIWHDPPNDPDHDPAPLPRPRHDLGQSEHERHPRVVADLEARWKNAGLVWRPTDETYAAGMTADRLGVDLVTEDSDVRKIGHPWHAAAMTIAEFACALAA